MKNENKLLEYISNDSITRESGEAANTFGLRNRVKDINTTLTMIGFQQIGDLFEPNYININKTLGIVEALLQDRQRQLEARSELMQKIGKQDHEIKVLHDKLEAGENKINDLTNRNNFFKNKLAGNDKKFAEDLEKLKADKDEALKSVNKMVTKENQYKHEIKKLEKEIEDMRTKLKKYMSNRDTSPLRSGTKVDRGDRGDTNTSALNMSTIPTNNGFNTLEGSVKNSLVSLNNINHMRDFYKLLFEAFNEKTKTILSENDELKECLSVVFKELNQYIELKKIIIQKITTDSVKDINNELFNDKIFKLSIHDSKETILNSFNDLVNIFRFVLVYDFLKIDPSKEFTYDDIKKEIVNTKYKPDDIPYYKDVKTIIDGFNLEAVNMLRGLVSPKEVGGTSRLSSYRHHGETGRTNRDYTLRNTNNVSTTNVAGTLDELNKDLQESIHMFKNKIDKIENELSVLETSDK
jgi:hypothetical protein